METGKKGSGGDFYEVGRARLTKEKSVHHIWFEKGVTLTSPGLGNETKITQKEVGRINYDGNLHLT